MGDQLPGSPGDGLAGISTHLLVPVGCHVGPNAPTLSRHDSMASRGQGTRQAVCSNDCILLHNNHIAKERHPPHLALQTHDGHILPCTCRGALETRVPRFDPASTLVRRQYLLLGDVPSGESGQPRQPSLGPLHPPAPLPTHSAKPAGGG